MMKEVQPGLLSGEFFLFSLCCIARCSPPGGHDNDSTTARSCLLLLVYFVVVGFSPHAFGFCPSVFPIQFFFNCFSYVLRN